MHKLEAPVRILFTNALIVSLTFNRVGHFCNMHLTKKLDKPNFCNNFRIFALHCIALVNI